MCTGKRPCSMACDTLIHPTSPWQRKVQGCCKLPVQIHPHVWGTWTLLAQSAGGFVIERAQGTHKEILGLGCDFCIWARMNMG